MQLRIDNRRRTPPPLPAARHDFVPDAARREPWQKRFGHYLARPLIQLGPVLFGAGVLASIVLAWSVRDDGYITAESGVGYWLGVAGAVMMLVLILYPLRKRFRILHGLGRVASWFRIHMVLGILGPTLIILHSNFKIGSLNSALALFTMLTVVASGIIGRYIYSKVHKGLYGRRAAIEDILGDVEALKSQIGNDLAGNTGVFAEIEAFNAQASAAPKSLGAGLWAASTISLRSSRTRRRILKNANLALHEAAIKSGWSRRQRRKQLGVLRGHLDIYFAAVTKAQKLALFERLFSMWHVLHMPLFILLALTVVLHIVAVHLY